MAAPLLQWPATSPAALVSGGTRDVDVVVQVTGPGAVQGAIDVTLSRLEGNVSNIWEVIGVQASSRVLTISLPPKGELLTSPAMVAGTGSAFEGVISQAFVFDHLYTTIGQAQVKGSSNGETTYTTTQPYTSSFQGGAYEASILVIQVIQLELLCVLLDGIRY